MGDTFIVAVDFGTAYSGYAFLMSGNDPILSQWGQGEGLTTSKTPTCVLFDENEQFIKFGNEAKRAYIRNGNGKAKKTLLFENFKMELYGKKLSEELMITAVNGKRMRALKVFTESLRYLKDHALKTIHGHTCGRTFTASDFTWVLTVPAIWDASAKQFMRKAATEAGIVRESQLNSQMNNKLFIALEPEAASIWCKQLHAKGFVDGNKPNAKYTLQQKRGTKYIVADCGGGTVDITVHEVLDGGALKELHKASGNDMGGEQVTKNFKSCMKGIFSENVWNDFESRYPSDLQTLMYNFIALKSVDEYVQIACPLNLEVLAQKEQPIENYFKNMLGVSWDNGSIQLSRAKMRSFFDKSLSGITKSLKEIFKKDLSIDYLLLVGGYALSEILRKHITKQFGAQCKVLCPASAQQAILKGAVMFGRNPGVVASRKSAFTYGIAVTRRFDASKHKPEKKFTTERGDRCDDLFKTLVTINEDVGWDETREHISMPQRRDTTAVRITFYRTERINPLYVDEWGIEKLNSFRVEMPNTKRGLNRELKLQVKFGFTEITATATDVDSKSTNSVKIDFLGK